MAGRPRHKLKAYEALMSSAERQGFAFTYNKHYAGRCPCGLHTVHASSTPSDSNAVHQFRRALVRTGCFSL